MFKRIVLFSLQIVALVPWIVGFVMLGGNAKVVQVLPTRIVLPTLTATLTLTPSATPTVTLTPTSTFTPTPTATFTATATPTQTPTLATRVFEISAIMPGVFVPPTATFIPENITLLSAPPQPIEPLPDATDQPPPYTGWYSFESDHPLVQYSAPWQPRQIEAASRGQYHRSENASSYVTFPFDGEGLRIRYVEARNMGIFEVVVDDAVIDTVDAFSSDLNFPATRVYFVGAGRHTLTLRNAQQKNPASEGYVVGLDAIQVFRGNANTRFVPPPSETATPTQVPRPAVSVELVSAPPSPQPTFTPEPETARTISLVIAYDENGNRAVDPAEGVRGISVRLVEVGTNRVMSQAFTDAQGYAELQVTSSVQMRLVTPYFSQVWDIPRTRSGASEASFTLLLEPGNQPGLIP
ncbi:MAG: hypothetical protein RLP44_26925 [Aggregatilineales bacterium]